MAYTNPWTVNVSGGEPADTIDTLLSKIRVDIQERLFAALFNTPYTDDPLVLKDEILGKKTSKKLYVHGVAFHLEANDLNYEEVNYDDQYIEVDGEAEIIRAPIYLPAGATIRRIKWLVYAADAGTVTMSLVSTQFDTGNADSVHNTTTKSSTGIEVIDSGALNFAVLSELYFLKADKSGGDVFRIHVVEITYDGADARVTI